MIRSLRIFDQVIALRATACRAKHTRLGMEPRSRESAIMMPLSTDKMPCAYVTSLHDTTIYKENLARSKSQPARYCAENPEL